MEIKGTHSFSYYYTYNFRHIVTVLKIDCNKREFTVFRCNNTKSYHGCSSCIDSECFRKNDCPTVVSGKSTELTQFFKDLTAVAKINIIEGRELKADGSFISLVYNIAKEKSCSTLAFDDFTKYISLNENVIYRRYNTPIDLALSDIGAQSIVIKPNGDYIDVSIGCPSTLSKTDICKIYQNNFEAIKNIIAMKYTVKNYAVPLSYYKISKSVATNDKVLLITLELKAIDVKLR